MDINQTLTLLVGIGVALVGYSQWRTANQRVVLDLFDRRIKVYDKIEDVLGSIVRHGTARHEDFRAFVQAKAEARFLFGNDVSDYLEKLIKDVAFMNTYTDAVIDAAPDRSNLLEKRMAVMIRLSEFFTVGPEIFGAYMRLDQRNTPFWRPW